MRVSEFQPYLDWISQQESTMVARVEQWASINSGTWNSLGVSKMADAVAPAFQRMSKSPAAIRRIVVNPIEQLDSRGERVRASLGPALEVVCRPAASRRVLLSIHLDTVYPADSDFQDVRRDEKKMYGPGVADAKGGIAVLVTALGALERYVADSGQSDIGWHVLLNPDEEIGSIGSSELLRQAASKNHVGLLFEPALPDGQLAGERKGTANFQIACRGRSAHSGRDFTQGRNAVVAAAEVATRIHALNGQWPDVTLNVGRIDGGGAANMVPDRAVVRVNVRYRDKDYESSIERAIRDITSAVSDASDVRVESVGQFTTPPKSIHGVTERILEQVAECGKPLGVPVRWKSTGGACDGNRLAGWGLPNVDTLGVRGGAIHSGDEFMIVESLVERAQLTALLLLGWASDRLAWPCGDSSGN
jgi:glutamate carboxypeptidase